MRFGKSTIRERFNEDFDKLGIECFTLYVQDRWQPAFYMPHEVDPYLYYPETMYSGPLREYFRPLLDGLNSSETSGTVYSNRVKKQVRLRYLCLNDAIASPLNTPCLLADYYDKPCFQNFVQREQIQSVIIFSPEVPIHAHAAQDAPELLFLNSRNARWRITSTPLSDNLSALHDLAKDILTFAHETFLRRTTSPRWNRALLRSVQNQSRLTDLMHSEFSRATPGSSTAHKHLCTRLLRVLWENYENRDSSLLATLHLLKSSEAKLSLVDEAYYPQSARPPKEQVFAPSRPDGISITLCTSLVGRPHLLSYVDPPTTPSVFLTGGEAQFLNHNRAKFPFELMRQIGFDLYHRKKLGNRVIRAFLVNENPSWDDIQAKMPLELRRIANKLRKRHEWHYGMIFNPLADKWGYGGSELCLPIVVSRQTLGCVNLECLRPFAINYADMNMLTALSTIIGMTIVNADHDHLLDVLQNTAELIHSRADVRPRLHEFAKRVRDHTRCDSIDFVRCRTSASFQNGYSPIRFTSSDQEALVTSWKGPAESGVAKDAVTQPRSDGWSSYVMKIAREARSDGTLAGVVIIPDDKKITRAVKHAVAVLDTSRLHYERSNASGETDYLKEAEYICFEELKSPPPPSTINTRWPESTRLLIGLVLEDPKPSGRETPDAVGVIWCAYYHPARIQVPAIKDWNTDWALRHCVAFLRSVARRCSPLPLAWSERLRQSGMFRFLVSHGHMGVSVETMDLFLEKSAREGSAILQRDVEWLSCHAKTADIHQSLYKRMEGVESPHDLVEDVHRVIDQARVFVATEQLIQDACDCALLEFLDSTQWPPKKFEIIIPDALRNLCTHASYLFLVIFHIVSNAVKYGPRPLNWTDSPVTIALSESADQRNCMLTVAAKGNGRDHISDAAQREAQTADIGEVITRGLPAVYYLGFALSGGTQLPEVTSTPECTTWSILLKRGVS